MKPVMFEYANSQKDGGFEDVLYDYESDLSILNGKTIIERSRINAAYVTKTKVQRESDDSPNDQLMESVTKTDVKREADDCSFDALVEAATKTFTERESDDTAFDPYVMLLTKTEQHAPETDE